MLGQIAMQTDGWTLLSNAASVIHRDVSPELQYLRKRFGHSTLKGVPLAAERFDVKEEPAWQGDPNDLPDQFKLGTTRRPGRVTR